MYRSFPLALLCILLMAACDRKKTNEEAPEAENVVFPIEFAQAHLAWRAGAHRVVIAFTDELNQSDKGVDKWRADSYCERNEKRRNDATVHVIWSGPTKNDKPDGGVFGDGDDAEDPFIVADCSGGTKKIIKDDASDLDLTSLPVTKALKGGALVEYLSETPNADNKVSLTIKTATADGTATFAHKQPLAGDAVAVDPAKNADIPADALTEVPATTLNNLKVEAEFSQHPDNPRRIKVNFLGLVDPATSETISLVANQNIFLSEGDSRRQKGLKVTQSRVENQLPVDLVFVIDNSGSMGEEADGVTSKITDFATQLAQSGLDVRFAALGAFGDVNGAVNFTDAGGLKMHLSRASGTSRTEGFTGADGKDLEEKAKTFSDPITE